MNDTQTTTVLDRLSRKAWAQNTDATVLKCLMDLPDNWVGFLEDLEKRGDDIGGLKVVRMVKLLKGNFGCLVQFEVQNAAGGTFTYEYFSWRHGPASGSKGLVFVRTAGKISHFIVLRAEKFAPAKFVWDSLGGFSEGEFNLNDDAVREVREELGAADIKVLEVHDLGRLMTDAGMTNNHPGVFAVVIDAVEASKVSRDPVNLDPFEVKAGAYVLPLSQLPELIMENGDTFFQAAVLRSVAKGIIPVSVLAPNE